MKLRFTQLFFLILFMASAFGQAVQPNNAPSKSKAPAKKTTNPPKTVGQSKKVAAKPSTSPGKSSATTKEPAEKSTDLTGIWRGYFAQSSFGFYEDRYKFEVQIDQATNDAVKGVTYSYKTTVFYGKATLQGVYTKTTKNLIIKEIKLVELKIGDDSQPCLMTCYLDYDKMGNLETLSGSYTSQNLRDKGNCGSGKVYLERTTTTDFYKEDFLVKKEEEAKKKANAPVKKPVTKPVSPSLAGKPKTTPPASANKVAKATPKIKPGAEGNLVPKKKVETTPSITQAPSVRDLPKTSPDIKPIPKPEILKKRSNELVKTIYTASKEIKIELYDNGEIDGDIISVYHNNELIVSHKKLTDKPIAFTVKIDENAPTHEFAMVAENLGSIPPNTALMIITAGSKRHELFIESTEKKNSVVVMEYQPN